MQHFNYDHPSVRYTGRFGRSAGMAATACGSYFEVAFRGSYIVLFFNTDFMPEQHGHVYLELDGGARFESDIQKYIRVDARADGEHTLKVIYKSNVEMNQRWYQPLTGKMDFTGYDAEDAGTLAPDNRKTIEIVGDSITEGVLIDAFRNPFRNDQSNRPFQDDVTATYGWLTAEALDLRPFMMGYGAVGNTHGGCGGVPKTADAYPFNFNGSPVTYPSCDYIMINHGANDRGHSDYLPEYEGVLDLIRARNPESVIIVLSPFCGAFDDDLPGFIRDYNEKRGDSVRYISSHGWVPLDPLHPLRDGHAEIAKRLIPEMKKII